MNASSYHERVELTISHPPDYQWSMYIIGREFSYGNNFNMMQLSLCFYILLARKYRSSQRDCDKKYIFLVKSFRVSSLSSQGISVGLVVPRFESSIFEKSIRGCID